MFADPRAAAMLVIGNLRDALSEHRQEVGRLREGMSISRAVVATAKTVQVKCGVAARHLEKLQIKLERLENLRNELSLETAYSTIQERTRKQVTEYDRRRIGDMISRDERVLKNAYRLLPAMLKMDGSQLLRFRSAWAYVGVVLYRAAIQPYCRDQAFRIFELWMNDEIKEVEAYYHLRVCLSTRPDGENITAGIEVSLVKGLLKRLDRFATRFSTLRDILIALRSGTAADRDGESINTLLRMLDIAGDDIADFERMAQDFLYKKPSLPPPAERAA